MMYQVVNPATGKLESEYPTATDAEISDVLARAERGYASWRRTPKAERAEILRRVAQLYARPRRRAGRDHHPGDGQDDRGGPGRAAVRRGIYRYYADNGAGAAQGRAAGLEHAGHGLGAQVPDRRAARHHAVELPVLPGRPVRGAEPDDRQHHRAQARAAVPGVGAGHGADLPRRRAARRRLHQRVRHQRAGRRP